MKKLSALSLLVVLATASLPAADKVDKKDRSADVTVNLHEPDEFTDVRSTWGMQNDDYYLKTLSDHLRKTAGRYLAEGQKLEITINDIDLAGEFLPTRAGLDQVRIIKDVFIPRVALTFKLTDASGQVVKEGERKLTDLNFMSNLSLSGRNEALFYDKALLTRWVQDEFRR